ncbi:MAG TPA: HAD-IA family hydrolase [Rhizomicrobium sp.]|jgi:putative hydrolase of the HAD superfamily|nr:HAD-IA family hydrolase [Rhizomicrobium sp.]
MIEAVIFDFGGVFTASPFEAFARYERERGLPPDLIRKINGANYQNNAWARFERAELDLEGFDRAFAEEARVHGHDVPGREIIALLAGEFRPEMIEALRRIKTKFKTGCITNNVPSNQQGSADGRALYAREVMMLFDHVIESAKAGIRKPDPRIYEMMCEALAVKPDACIYLDDLGVNLKPARAMGMATIKVESGPQAIAELEAATGMKLA